MLRCPCSGFSAPVGRRYSPWRAVVCLSTGTDGVDTSNFCPNWHRGHKAVGLISIGVKKLLLKTSLAQHMHGLKVVAENFLAYSNEALLQAWVKTSGEKFD